MLKKPVDTETEQVVHTPMGTTIEPAKFVIGDKVMTSAKISTDNIEIPENVELTVMGVIGDNMYSLIGPNNLVVKLDGAYLEKSVGGNVWGNL